MDCLFCKIIAGEIPGDKVFEDESVLVFRDIAPKAPVHLLVVPKQHIGSAAELDEGNSAVVAHIFEVVAQLARRLGLEKGFRVVTNCGEDAGQTVAHLHFHLLAGERLSDEFE